MTISEQSRASSPPLPLLGLRSRARESLFRKCAQCGRWNHRVATDSARIPEVFPGRASAALSRARASSTRLNASRKREHSSSSFSTRGGRPALFSWSGRDCAPFSTQAQSSVDISPMLSRTLPVADSRGLSSLLLSLHLPLYALSYFPRYRTPRTPPLSLVRDPVALSAFLQTSPRFLCAANPSCLPIVSLVCDLSPFLPVAFAQSCSTRRFTSSLIPFRDPEQYLAPEVSLHDLPRLCISLILKCHTRVPSRYAFLWKPSFFPPAGCRQPRTLVVLDLTSRLIDRQLPR